MGGEEDSRDEEGLGLFCLGTGLGLGGVGVVRA